MKIPKSKLNQIIKEETVKLLKEVGGHRYSPGVVSPFIKKPPVESYMENPEAYAGPFGRSAPAEEEFEDLDLEEHVYPVTYAAGGSIDEFEHALITVVKDLVPGLSEEGESRITRNIGELQQQLQSAINRSDSVESAGKEFINDIAAMVEKF